MSMKKEKTSTKKTVVDVKKIMAAWTVGCQPPEAAPRCRDSRLGLIKEGDKKKQSRNPSVLAKKRPLGVGAGGGFNFHPLRGARPHSIKTIGNCFGKSCRLESGKT